VLQFLAANEDTIARDLLRKENESLFKQFYHLRWFQQLKQSGMTRKLLRGLSKANLLEEENASSLMVHILNGIGQVLRVFCDYVDFNIQEAKSRGGWDLIKIYS